MPAKFLYNLTKNLTAFLTHKFCAVLPKISAGHITLIKKMRNFKYFSECDMSGGNLILKVLGREFEGDSPQCGEMSEGQMGPPLLV